MKVLGHDVPGKTNPVFDALSGYPWAPLAALALGGAVLPDLDERIWAEELKNCRIGEVAWLVLAWGG